MAVVKHMAMNLVRNPKDKHSLKVRHFCNNPAEPHLDLLCSAHCASRWLA
jgi:hypothetical protein